ncbi:MAG: DUF3341 domain-containing protein [Planctomycetes bacterium]|nr:DUF3341 domain-containing protein [Planctomycetota bacterium]
MQPDTKTVVGVFPDPRSLVEAARAARERGHPPRDAYTPHPVHGLDEALGIRANRLPHAALILGATGLAVALLFQFWVVAIDWPARLGGKNERSILPLVPIAFELTVLFAAIGTVLVFFAQERLWPGRAPRHPSPRALDDGFVLVIDVPAGEVESVREFLAGSGAGEVRVEGGG